VEPGAATVVALLAAVATAWLWPGLLLWQLLRDDEGDALDALAFAAALGLAWLVVPVSAALLLGWDMERLVVAVVVLNGVLGLAGAVQAAMRPPFEGRRGRARPPAALGLAFVLLTAALVAVSALHPGFTGGGDEWFLMRAIRYFTEARPITDTQNFAVWEMVVGLLVRLAGVELVDVYRAVLVPLLVPLGVASMLALARVALPGLGAPIVAMATWALLCLSQMNTRGDGAGMSLLVRLGEDRYLTLLVLTPAALALFLRALERSRRKTALAAAAVALAAVVLYPFALFWLLAGAAGPLLASSAVDARLRSWKTWAAAAALLAVLLGVGWGLRSLRPPEYFRLQGSDWAMRPRLFEIARRHIVVVSAARELYMVNPRELDHPLVVTALAGTLLLLPHARRARGIALVCSAMLIPPVLTLNPLTASLLGRLVTPWALPRLLWALPVPLAVAALLQLAAGRLRARGAAWRVGAAVLLAAVAAASLAPRIAASFRALRARNHATVEPAERELMRFMAGERRLRGPVIAPAWLSVRVPSWSSRFYALPGPDYMRIGDQARIAEYKQLYRARRLGGDELLVVRRHGPHVLVIAASDSRLDRLLKREPGFLELHRNGRFALHQFRAELWPQSTP
jgi:hypothetical protein